MPSRALIALARLYVFYTHAQASLILCGYTIRRSNKESLCIQID